VEWQPDPKRYPSYLARKIKAGRGCGAGVGYRSWYTTAEIKSRGNCDTPNSIRNGRSYELLSDFEALYFYILERKPTVRDAREQFPILDIAGTQRICADLGIRHKTSKDAKRPEPYTIDFLVTEEDKSGELQTRGASIKPPEPELDELTLAKLDVERIWCESNGLPWAVIDMKDIPNHLTMLSTLRYIRKWYQHRFEPEIALRKLFREHFMFIYERNVTLHRLLERTAKRTRLPFSHAEDAFRHAAWVRDIPVSLDHEIALDLPLVLLQP
jgi:hypothetical protein